MSAERLALLQLCDSLFPVGSFAHSDGLEATVADAIEAYFSRRLAACVSAAMRLMPLGQIEAHQLLATLLHEVPACAARVAAAAEPPRAFSPHMDIATMRHQYVHSRLFRS